MAVMSLPVERVSAADRPNVIIILADDLGWADPGCYGSRYHKTPHIDQLARDGMRFTDAYAACPVCSPTRASIMTGKYPARLNLTDWLPGRPDRPDQKLLRPVINQRLPANEITLAAALKRAGYRTAHIGKWHLGGKGASPEDFGFDLNIAGDSAGSPRSYFAPYRSKDGRFMPGLEQAPSGEYLTDRLTTEAEKFIEANREKQFFLYLAHYTVHIPLTAKADLIAKYKPGRPGQQGNPIYAAMIESLDDSVGRVLKKLDDLKLAQRTLVIFFSDNGGLCTLEGPNTPPTINSPLREGKGYLYEGGIRVPLIVRWPGVTKPGTINNQPICSIDFMPTILHGCNVDSDVKFDGIDISLALEGNSLPERALFWHYPHYSNQGGRPGSAIRNGDYKLVEFFENERRELFNIRRDPGETRNLIAIQPKIADELSRGLASWRTDVGAKMMSPNPSFVPNPQGKDGTITLPARTAEVHGIQLRFEPLPHKNTLGFWTESSDWASWEFTVTNPGKFSLEVLQGCGKGQGGSEVELSIANQSLSFTVEDTGGFQNFKSREIGSVTIEKPGRYTLEVRPKKKAAAAIMDLRAVTLTPRK
jgi:arylsulfatase A-like enzyme